MEKYRDVTFDGANFRINLPSAREGSWIMTVLAGKKIVEPEYFDRAFDILLGRCHYFRDVNGQQIPQELYKAGRWLVPELEMDSNSDLAMQLFSEALTFLTDPTTRRSDLESKT